MIAMHQYCNNKIVLQFEKGCFTDYQRQLCIRQRHLMNLALGTWYVGLYISYVCINAVGIRQFGLGLR